MRPLTVLLYLCAILCAGMLASCALRPAELSAPDPAAAQHDPDAALRPAAPPAGLEGESPNLAFTAQAVRTGNTVYVREPVVTIVDSVIGLGRYIEENKEQCDFSHHEDPAADNAVGFADAVAEYDEDWFADHRLVLVHLGEGSGSVRHEVTEVTPDVIEIVRLLPEESTADEAAWHILIGVERADFPNSGFALKITARNPRGEEKPEKQIPVTAAVYGDEPVPPAVPSEPDEQDKPEEPDGYEDVEFTALAVRTDGYHDGARYPAVTVIDSAGELARYTEEFGKLYDFSHKEKVYSDSTVGFVDAVAGYDEAWFADHRLVLVLLEEGSGSVRFEVMRVTTEPAAVIGVHVPEICTDDMAEWHILIELDRSVDVSGEFGVRFVSKGTE